MANIFKNKIVQATLAILGVGVAFGAGGTKEINTNIVSIISAYTINQPVKSNFILENNAFQSNNNLNLIYFGEKGSTYFVPELNVGSEFNKFSFSPRGIKDISDATFSISPTGTIIYSDSDNHISYIFYLKERYCDYGVGIIEGKCTNKYKYDFILENGASNIIYFGITTTLALKSNNNVDTWYYQDISPDEVATDRNVLEIDELIIRDSVGNTTSGKMYFGVDINGAFYKLEIQDEWFNNAVKPIVVDPTITITSGGSANSTAMNQGSKIARDANGILYVLYLNSLNKIVLASSTNDGTTWATSTIVDTGYDCAQGESILIDQNNLMHIVFTCKYSGSTSNIQVGYITSTNGNNFSPIYWITSNSSYPNQSPTIATDSLGNKHIVFLGKNGSTATRWRTFYRRLSSTGIWSASTSLVTTSNDNYYGDVMVDNRDYVHVIIDGYDSSSKRKVRYVSSTDNGTTFSTAYTLPGPDKYYYAASGVIDLNNNVWALWYASTTYTSSSNSGNWGTMRTLNQTSTDATGCITVNKKNEVDAIWLTPDPINLGIKHCNITGGIESSTTTIVSGLSSGSDYPSCGKSSYPNGSNIPYSGFHLIYSKDGNVIYYRSDDFSWSAQSGRPTSTYDANRPTSTFRAYMGAEAINAYNTTTGFYYSWYDNSTSVNPFSTDRTQWGPGMSANGWAGTEFSTTNYGYITTTDQRYATTSLGVTTSAYWLLTLNLNDFEVYATESPAMAKNYIPAITYRANNITSTSPTATAAMDDRLYMLNYCNNSWTQVAANLNGSGTTTGSILTTTTFPWTISNKTCYAIPTSTTLGNRWLSRYIISSVDVDTDCYNIAASTTKMVCAYMAVTSTGPEGTPSGYACYPQPDDRDDNNQCPPATPNNFATGCATGNCAGETGFPFECGKYIDNAQHSCPTCAACPSGLPKKNPTCTWMNTGAGNNLYGCVGQCKYCAGASGCSTVPNWQSGACTGGQLCCSGNCITANACNQICNTCGVASCRANGQQAACVGAGGTVGGAGIGCLPTNFCCCGA